MSKKKKIDYRKGNRASQRTVQAMNVIREVLSQGDATFGVLLEKTGLSRRGLASNLKRLLKMREIKVRIDKKDHRVKHYSLTDEGWERYRQQKVSQILRQVELTPLGCVMDSIVEYIAAGFIAATNVTECQRRILRESERLPQLTKYERGILLGCLQGKIYANSSKNENVKFFEALKEFLAITKLIAACKDIDIELLKGLPDLVFVFKLSRDKLIEQYKKLRKARRIWLTEDFMQFCKSMNEKDFAEFIKTLGS